MTNPFNDSLDWALRGKYVEVTTDRHIVRGYVERVHHQRGSVVLHDGKRKLRPKHVSGRNEWSQIGAAFIRTAESIVVVDTEQSKNIRLIDPRITIPYKGHSLDFGPVEHHMRQAYRNGFTGGYPVVRPLDEDHDLYDTNDRYQILNGHKRIEAAKRVGLTMHPMETFRCTDEVAEQLFNLAHPEEENSESESSPLSEVMQEEADDAD